MNIQRVYGLIILFNLFFLSLHAQPSNDSIITPIPDVLLQDIEVIGYLQPQSQLLTPASVGILNETKINLQSVNSMVPALNTIPGVRMEERSPGSYRLSIRGSLVRSPYGVRNVKVYYNDFSLTDAGGNTYLNLINVNDLSGVEILKGPDGSLFGANSGGVVFLRSDPQNIPALKINAYSGSKGLIGNSLLLTRQTGKHTWSFRQSYQRSDGYRRNSRNHRLFFQVSDRWQYHPDYYLDGYLFYSDLDYRTPGGLTEEQYNEDPKQSRPASKTQPGSVEQKTRITTRMYFGGIRHKASFKPWLNHTVSVWGNYVDFIYPFITNYEIRNEKNMGIRTYFTLTPPARNSSIWKSSFDIGFEGQRLITDAWNYDNHAGEKGDIQAYNNIVNSQQFGFLRGRLEFENRLIVEAAVSLNANGYHFRDTTHIRNNFPKVWMPHIALNYRLSDPIALRLTFSKGYSTPTTAEVRPSDNKIYTDLHAEQGWNMEIGVRGNLLNGRFSWDISGYHYLLKDGIVSQTDSTENTFFVNSGKIKQWGLECTTTWLLLPFNQNRTFFKEIRWNGSYNYSHYKYDEYVTNGNNHSGNRVAGVPRNVLINNLHLRLPSYLSLFIQHNYTGRIPLNDANTSYANAYHLVSARLTWSAEKKLNLPVTFYLYADNLLNQKYSLGNDINAFGGRYYNAASPFNMQVGMRWDL